MEQKEEKFKGTFALILVAIQIEVKYSKVNRLRNLQDNSSNLTEIIKQAHLLNLQKNLEGNDTYSSESGNIDYLTYQYYNKEGYTLYKTASESQNLAILNTVTCSDQNDDTTPSPVFHVTTYNSEVASILYGTNASDRVQVGVVQNGTTLSDCTNMKIGLTISDSLNSDLYKYYLEKGIDIYNPKDKAFTDACYISKNFDYDLTQKYRRNNLYQGYSLNIGTDCTYDSFDLTTNRIIATCSNATNPIEYTLVEKSLTSEGIKVNHVDNLPTKCGGDVENIEENIAHSGFI